jgi:curli biogenesis system outer membrane secretion channel CsgG
VRTTLNPPRSLLADPPIRQKAWRLFLALVLCLWAVSAAAELGLRVRDAANSAGVEVTQVLPGSVAAQSGIKAGDIILQLEKNTVASAEQFAQRIRSFPEASPFSVRISRDGWERDLMLQPSAAPMPRPAQTATEPSARPEPLVGPQLYPQARGEMSLDQAAHQAYATDLDLAEKHYQNANWPEAERYYQRAIQRVPNDPASWGRLAHALIMQQKFREAVGACNKSLALGVPQPSTLVNLGYSHFKLGDLIEARSAYLRAVELAPHWAQAYSGLGAVYVMQQDWAQAEKYYRLALDRDPGNAADRQALDGALRMQRQLREVQATPLATNRLPAEATASSGVTAASLPRRDPEPLPPASAFTGPVGGQRDAAPAGRKAMVTVGAFQVKAAGAGQFIGDGMREMLVTTLHNSGNYVVVERMELQGLAAEQALSRSRMARPGAAIAERQMDVAEIMVSAAVTEFESEAKGGGVQFGIPNLPLNLGRQTKTAHMAIDVRVVDVATGRLLAAQRITGDAKSSQTTLGATVSVDGTAIPTTLGAFKNTPMEQAIRECIQKATAYVTSTTPQQYFRHQ